MFASVVVTNFRGFRRLEVKTLSRVNLIVGENDVGKTSLLEALFLRVGHNAPDFPLRLNRLRWVPRVPQVDREAWEWFFHRKRTEDGLSVATESDGEPRREVHLRLASPTVAAFVPGRGSDRRAADTGAPIDLIERRELVCELIEAGEIRKTVRMTLDDDGTLRCEDLRGVAEIPGIYLGPATVPLPENAERLSELDRRNRLKDLLDPMTAFDPRIRRVSSGIAGGQPVVYIDLGFAEMLPASFSGNGIHRLLSILLAIHASPGGVVLVDEVENGLYHGKMVQTWTAIAKAARSENVQVFATTHSFECVRAAHESFSSNPPFDLLVHRLERTADGDIRVITMGEHTLRTAIEQNWEIR